MQKLLYDGCSILAKQRNFIYCINELKYSQSCAVPLQTNTKYLYLRDGFIFPSDMLIGKEFFVQIKNIEYGDVVLK